MPKPEIDDPRCLTPLEKDAFSEAAKAYGAERKRWNVHDSEGVEVACWEATLAALRVYEFERTKAGAFDSDKETSQ